MPENPPPPTWIEPPPPKPSGMGCFAKGCLITILVLVLIFCCFIVAGFFGAHYVAKTYLAPAPSPIPVASAAPEEVRTLKQEWKAFKQTAARNESLPPVQRQSAHLEYSAGQINQLISASKARGYASVAISNGVMQISFSVPPQVLRKVHTDLLGAGDRYANGSISLTTQGPTSVSQVNVSNAQLNGRPVSNGILDTDVGGYSLRDYAARYANENSLGTFQIVGDKVVFDSQ